MVERPLCMREVPGSIPGFSIFVFFSFLFYTKTVLPLFFNLLVSIYYPAKFILGKHNFGKGTNK